MNRDDAIALLRKHTALQRPYGPIAGGASLPVDEAAVEAIMEAGNTLPSATVTQVPDSSASVTTTAAPAADDPEADAKLVSNLERLGFVRDLALKPDGATSAEPPLQT